MLRHVQQLPQIADAIWNYDTAGIEAGLSINRHARGTRGRQRR